MKLSSVHVYPVHFTLTDQPIRSLPSPFFSLMMGAQHIDPRLNPQYCVHIMKEHNIFITNDAEGDIYSKISPWVADL